MFVLSTAEASPGDMILMRRHFGALGVTATTGWFLVPSSTVSSVALGEHDESDSRTACRVEASISSTDSC